MKLILSLLLLAGFASPAGDPAGFHIWTAAELKAFARTLAPKAAATHLAVQQLANEGNHSFMVILRQATGDAEYHATQADIIVVESGQATLVYGGQMVDGKTIQPNEIRGPSINGGMEKKLAPGDVVHIPPRTPHQVKVDPGKPICYLTVKVTE